MDNLERLKNELADMSEEEKEILLAYVISLKSENDTELALSLN